jgi:hypothetical protein
MGFAEREAKDQKGRCPSPKVVKSHHCGHIWELIVPHLPFRCLEFKGVVRAGFVVPYVLFRF